MSSNPNLVKAREDVRRLLASKGNLSWEAFDSAFRQKYGRRLDPRQFGRNSLQQLLEVEMRDVVKIIGCKLLVKFHLVCLLVAQAQTEFVLRLRGMAYSIVGANA